MRNNAPKKKHLGFNHYLSSNILRELDTIKVFVTVPAIALVSEAEVTEQMEASNFIDGVPVRNKKGLQDPNKARFTGDPVSFVDGEAVKESIYNKSNVRIPVSAVIDIYHSGYSVYISKEEDVLTVATILSDILDRLEGSVDGKQEEVTEYIEEFYTKVIEGKAATLDSQFARSINRKSNMIGFTDHNIAGVDRKRSLYINLADITIK